MNLSRSLKVGIATRGITQSQLSDKSFIGKVTISKISKGHTGVSIENVFSLADALDYKLSEFIALGED